MRSVLCGLLYYLSSNNCVTSINCRINSITAGSIPLCDEKYEHIEDITNTEETFLQDFVRILKCNREGMMKT